MQLMPIEILDITEIKSLHNSTENEIVKLNNEIKDIDDNILILDSTEKGISRREEILNIKALDTDTMDDRRFRVWLNWYDSYPYTNNDLRTRLDRVLGQGQYVLTVDNMNLEVKCLIELTSKKMENDVRKLLDEIVPMNMKLTVILRYNQWQTFSSKTWSTVNNLTWQNAREEVI